VVTALATGDEDPGLKIATCARSKNFLSSPSRE